ncbi:hypothetical protein SAY86_005643 [Trapa natans]|uniref:Uncharacterized protein n=1 Tax=Trapa natans TaxID=22666 RepID=A0AAN7L1T4_TRANT|nr:hypothetical protein SAY86_005643 [Trapa natans]
MQEAEGLGLSELAVDSILTSPAPAPHQVKRRISDYKNSFSCGKLSDPRHKDRIPRVDAVVVDEELVGSQEAHGCGAKILHGEDINQCEYEGRGTGGGGQGKGHEHMITLGHLLCSLV